LKEGSSSKNTKHSTNTWIKILKELCATRGINNNSVEMLENELNLMLERCYIELDVNMEMIMNLLTSNSPKKVY